MQDDGIKLKGEKDGVNLIINVRAFNSMDSLLGAVQNKMKRGKKFYRDAVIKVTTDTKLLEPRDLKKIKGLLFDEFKIKDCTFADIKVAEKKVFTGVNEGRTKFVKKTIRSGQRYEYSGNIVIVGDVNPGAEVYADGNIIVLGTIRGSVHAGFNGNSSAIIAAFKLMPQIMQIATVITRSPEDMVKPLYPELAKIKNGNIVVEPYLINKYI